MARDLFGDVSSRSVKLGSQAWYTVPFSIAAHVIATALLIVVPIASADMLPMPTGVEAIVKLISPPPPPAAPPTARVAQSNTPARSAVPAPTQPPNDIAPESEAVVPPAFPGGGVTDGIGLLPESTPSGLVHIPLPPQLPPARVPDAVRPGGRIKPPTKIHHVAPSYPRMAQAAKVDGMVILEAVIGVDGRVQDVRVLRSKPLLDQAAIEAVRQWRFTPTLLNGVPVPVIMTVTVNFALDR